MIRGNVRGTKGVTMPQQTIKPDCLSIILCDAIFTDPTTGKLTLLGVMDYAHAKDFPINCTSLVLYFELTNGRGDFDINLRVVRATADKLEGEEIRKSEAPIKVKFTEPRTLQRGMFDASGTQLPEPGEYRFILEGNGEYIAERRMTAIRRES